MGHPDDSWKTVGREIWAKIKTGGGQGAGGGTKSLLGLHESLQMAWIFTQAQRDGW